MAYNPTVKKDNLQVMEDKRGGREVRRLNILYFLSRNGHIEQPHLIRIHHFSHNGVFLRDVKRWISELRGDDTANSFAWSYKRRYKQTKFVWQDLLDGDLITPISDNEYILKGTQIFTDPIYDDHSASCDEKEVVKHKKLPLFQAMAQDQTLPKQVSKEESPPFSSSPFVLAYSTSLNRKKETIITEDEEHDDENESFRSCFFNSSFLKKSKNKKNEIGFDMSTSRSSISSTPSSSLRSRSSSHGSSNVLHNLATYKDEDINIKQSKSYKGTPTPTPTRKSKGVSSMIGLFIPSQITSNN